MKPTHRRGPYQRYARMVTTTANKNPLSLCWRDGLPLSAHPPHATWTAGHTITGSPTARPWLHTDRVPPPGDWLAPEASCCNYSAGARTTNTTRANPRSRNWIG